MHEIRAVPQRGASIEHAMLRLRHDGKRLPFIALNIPKIVSSSPSAVNRSWTVASVRLLSRAATRLTLDSTCLRRKTGGCQNPRAYTDRARTTENNVLADGPVDDRGEM